MASSDEDVVAARANRGSADEDEESVDEDFHASSDSDPAEEYDSGHESSGKDSGSDADMKDADLDADVVDDDDDGDDADEEERKRPTKKTKQVRT